MNRIAIAMALAASVTLTACSDDAQIASQNLSKAADNFEVSRRIIFYNGITDTYMLTIEGLCSISVGERKLDVTCKTGPGQYKKHFLGLSDNVTFFAEQLEGKSVSAYHYRVTFKPQSIIPDVNFRVDGKELTANQ
ncbi:hypothetical protein [Agrobacterium pusense]|uniref:beta-sandwich lipoprotein n=1 Tax=Agrobacterium pusense TaxID=648995 RepID=UPI0005144280|nr:hypothetical protein [Agrobacterium pusense]ANV24468.1 hypothetical protein BA939_11335 [Rhizobium sp. S41]KGE81464.1 hypothetical protein LW14_17630 [Rhizobium sp. H41]QWW74127.1 hypothetical protein KP800_01045 [Agrobacterium pusense]